MIEKNFLDAMMDKEVIQVRIGLFQVVICFECGGTIDIESDFTLTCDSDFSEVIRIDCPSETSKITCLLGKRLCSLKPNLPEEIHINFNEGKSLVLRAAEDGKESTVFSFEGAWEVY